MQQNQPILLTGVNGFCASRLRAHLQSFGPVVGLSHAELDITDRSACARVLAQHRPSVLIHSAAISDMRACESNPERSYGVNVLGTEHLAIACAETGTRMIHFSTDQVYGGTGSSGPHREDAPLRPASVYGRHKLEAEERILRVSESFIALRLTWMYDFRVRNLRTGRNLLLLCQRAICTRTPLTLPSATPRGITYVHEVIRQIPALWDAPGGAYNFGSAGGLTPYESARLIFKLAGAENLTDDLLIPENEPAGTYADLRMDCGRAAEQGITFPETGEGFRIAFDQYGW
ncbi:MAG: NAD(P)-dependent oxidoreductase [Clostridiales bacterium]|nr:NAD(P)-dependent oxidoreductase [Clostridiales bacterium]